MKVILVSLLFSSSPGSFSLLCWNIDDLDYKDTIERAQAVCEFIQSKRPHFVFLQEVIPATEREIIAKLGSNYYYFCAPKPQYGYRYFIAILLLKTEDITVSGGVETLVFPQSVMSRHVIKVPITFRGVEIELFTSHIESLEEYSEERKNQLSTVFRMITEIQKKNPAKNCIFGGDLNVIDEEFREVYFSPNTVDVWEACGSQEETKYTWDMGENDNREWTDPPNLKLHLDRLYLSSCDGKVATRSFSIIGKERLPGCKRFPSDHWGLWTEFSLV